MIDDGSASTDPEKGAESTDAVASESTSPAEQASSTSDERNMVQLPRAGALLIPEANEVTSDISTRVVVLVGDAESGKTTLMGTIYINFLQGPYQDLRFAGSRTLFALEERSFLALAKSGLHPPGTPRTLYGERQTFLQISLASKDDLTVSILVGDMSGEYFDRAVDSLDELKKLDFIRRADHLTILVDGAKAADPEKRHVGRARLRQLLRRMMESGLVRKGGVQIVVTKWDCIAHAGKDAVAFADSEAAELVEVARKFGKPPTTFRTAARSDYPDLVSPGMGVYDLLNSWLAPREVVDAGEGPIPSSKPFDLFRVE